MKCWQKARVVLLSMVTAAGMVTPSVGAGSDPFRLGAIDFPTSGSEEAQRHFLRGVAAMHSFWYEEALVAFRESTKADPNFAMGYWGEAMAHNHPVWREQDTEAGQAVLAKIRSTDQITARERAYMNAVRILYGQGDKAARDKAYTAAMEQLYRNYPDDLEAACFYALSLLGVARQPDEGVRTRIKAGALALKVFHQNQNHPCGVHYAIHAFDDPDHAILALPAAQRYAEIAPISHHAQHMPAHIFVQLGMWPEAAASTRAGWETSKEWVARESLTLNLRDYHSLHWLMYVSLQQGRYQEARGLIALKRKDMSEFTDPSTAMGAGFRRDVTRDYDEMAAAYVVETEQWESAPTFWGSAGSPNSDASGALPIFTVGLAAAMRGQPETGPSLAALRELREKHPEKEPSRRGDRVKMLQIRESMVVAAAHASVQNHEDAIALMKKAAALEEELSPPSGPPDTIKPPHELLGEILLRAGRPDEAAKQFMISLRRHPNRARSLLGAARAAAQTGDHAGAMTAYRKFLEVWVRADADLPELKEARAYVVHGGKLSGCPPVHLLCGERNLSHFFLSHPDGSSRVESLTVGQALG